MTSSLDRTIQDLGREYPDWKPWLKVVEHVLREAADQKWESFVPAATRSQAKTPLLSGVSLAVDQEVLRKWLRGLMRTAAESGSGEMSTLKQGLGDRIDPVNLFDASLRRDTQRLQQIAAGIGVDAAVFQPVAELVAIPFLQACGRRWAASAAEKWRQGFCPICGAWPALAEVRGIERSRYLRCARCAGEWEVHCLLCPFCDMSDHDQLVSLVPESGGRQRTIDACKRCLGYIKSLTVLQAISAEQIIVNDLTSVDLDVAALEQGYRRPQGVGYSLDINMIENKSGTRGFFRWSS